MVFESRACHLRPRLHGYERYITYRTLSLGERRVESHCARNWRERSLKASEYAAEAKSWSDDASKVERMMVLPRSRSDAASQQRLAGLDGIAKNYRDHERSNRELASKYARAAARPWLPIE